MVSEFQVSLPPNQKKKRGVFSVFLTKKIIKNDESFHYCDFSVLGFPDKSFPYIVVSEFSWQKKNPSIVFWVFQVSLINVKEKSFHLLFQCFRLPWKTERKKFPFVVVSCFPDKLVGGSHFLWFQNVSGLPDKKNNNKVSISCGFRVFEINV